jgi:hypothetical protein
MKIEKFDHEWYIRLSVVRVKMIHVRELKNLKKNEFFFQLGLPSSHHMSL